MPTKLPYSKQTATVTN